MVIFGGDPVVGHALELLLQTDGCAARFLVAPTVDDKIGELLADAQLVILAPGLSARRRKGFLTSIETTPPTTHPPVLELVTTLEGAQAGQLHSIPWPCGLEKLTSQMDDIMAGPDAREP